MATRKTLTPVDPRQPINSGVDPLAADPPPKTAAVPSTSSKTAEETAKAKGEATVLVNIPKAFKLSDDGHQITEYAVGAARMPMSHATHWFAKAHGVSIIPE